MPRRSARLVAEPAATFDIQFPPAPGSDVHGILHEFAHAPPPAIDALWMRGVEYANCALTDDSQIEALRALVSIAHASLNKPTTSVPDSLFHFANRVHDIIFDVSPSASPSSLALQMEIVGLCETWVLQKRNRYEDLVPQMVSLLVVRVLAESAREQDVERLARIAGSMHVIDFQDEHSSPFLRLLLHCALRSLVLSSALGRRLIAEHIFAIGPSMIASLTSAVKAKVSTYDTPECAHFGEVYARGWLCAPTAECRAKIEEGLQEFMLMLLSVTSAQPAQLGAALAHLLSGAHRKAHAHRSDDGDAGQEALGGDLGARILQLWEPIFPRALKAAAPESREHATAVFIHLFSRQQLQHFARRFGVRTTLTSSAIATRLARMRDDEKENVQLSQRSALPAGSPERRLCVVCLEQPRAVRYRPCGHGVLCGLCAIRHIGSEAGALQCVICRSDVSQLEWKGARELSMPSAGMRTDGRCEPACGEIYDGTRRFLLARAADEDSELAAEAARVLAELGESGEAEELDWFDEDDPLREAEERANAMIHAER